jgi:neopullulanase
MNYLFTKACLTFFIKDLDQTTITGTGYSDLSKGTDAAQSAEQPAKKFEATIDQLLQLYPSEITAAQLNLLDSHDTSRFLTSARHDESALRLATLFQMTYPGAPSIYYGDEIGLAGSKDPECRRTFPWDETKWNTNLQAYFKKAIALRHRFPALRRGEYHALYAVGSLYIFGRKDKQDRLVIALNVADTPVELPLINDLVYFPEDGLLLNIFSGNNQAFRIGPQGRVAGLTIPARSGNVFQVLRLNE